MSVYLSHIAAPNLGRGVDADLGRITVITGENGRGKSAHLRAVALALTGVAPNVLGRAEVRAAGTLNRVLPGDGAERFTPITATFSDGAEATFAGFGARGHTLPSYIHPGNVHRYQEVVDTFSGDPDRSQDLRKFVLRAACRDLAEGVVKARIPAELLPVYDAVAATVQARSLAPIETFLLVIEALRSTIAEVRHELAGKAAALTLALTDLEPRPDAAAATAAATRMQRLTALVGYKRLYENRKQGQTLLAAERARNLRIVKQIEALDPLPPTAPGTLSPVQTAALTLMEYSRANSVPRCLLCGTTVTAETAHFAHTVKEKADAFQAKHAAEAQAYAKLAAIHREGAQVLKQSTQTIADYEAALRTIEAQLPPGGVNPAEWPDVDLTGDIEAQAQEARTAAEKIQRTLGQWEAIDRITDAKKKLETNVEELTGLDRVLSAVAPEIIKERREVFERAVSRYIGKDEDGNAVDFGLLLDDPETNPQGEARSNGICRWGWRRKGKLVENLSVGQRARTFLAITLATTDPSAAYALVTVDQADLTANTLTEVLTVLTETCPSNVQVILANATAPSAVPEGVTHLDLEQHAPTITQVAAPRKRTKRAAA